MKKTVNLLTLSVFMVSNILTPLTNFIYATETETVEEVDDVAVVRDVIGEDTPELSPETSTATSPEGTDNDSVEEVGTPTVDNVQTGETNYPEVQPEDQSVEGTQEGEQVNETPSNVPESHNSAINPSDNTQGEEEGETVTEIENQDVQAEERILMEDQNRDIMGVCPGNQAYNEYLDICYSVSVLDRVPVYYGTDMDPTHKYNDNPIGTITVFVPIENEEVPITMMDMNMGATSKDISSEDSYGELYQWGNNAGIKNAETDSNRVQYNNYWPGHRYKDSTFRKGDYDYWRDSNRNTKYYDNLRGGGRDVNDSTNVYTFRGGIKNGKTRQGPCPDGYHVPSMGEWNVLVTYWSNKQKLSEAQLSYTELNNITDGGYNNLQKAFILPNATNRYYSDGSMTNRNPKNYWTSSPTSDYPTTPYNSHTLAMSVYNNSVSTSFWTYNTYYRSQGYSVRCFKDSPNFVVHEITFHDESKNLGGVNDNGELKQLVEDGYYAEQPVEPSSYFGEFLGWTEDLNSTDYFDFSNPVEEDMDLYAKWECNNGGQLSKDGTKCIFTGTMILDGKTFNTTLKTLAKGEPVTDYSSGDSLIKGFEWKDSLPIGINIGEDTVVISTENSDYPVYAWFDTDGYDNGEGIIYYTSKADIIYMNPDSGFMFHNMQGLTSLDLSNLDTSKTIIMANMFNSCNNLKTLILDGWDLSQSTNGSSIIGSMFTNASSLENVSMRGWKLPTTFMNALGCRTSQLCTTTLQRLDVTDWDLSRTTSLYALFASNETRQIIGLDTWDTSNVTDMGQMFYYCSNLTELDLSNFDTSNITDMSYMFYSCSNLTELDLSNFDTSNVTNMYMMFQNCNNLTELNLSNFDTSNVTDMRQMFLFDGNLINLDLSNFVVSNNTEITNMFTFPNGSALEKIYATNLFNGTSEYSVFINTTSLVGGAGTTYNTDHQTAEYARIDGGPTSSTPGYFTAASNITYNLNGGELRNVKHAYSPLFAFKLAIPVKEGYTFIGWTGSNGDTPEREVTVPKGTEGDLEYTAHWEINNYKIIFDTVGGDDIDPIEIEYNSSLASIELPTPEKECNDFLGWEPELPETMPAEDITLVAQWNDICSVDPQPDPAPQPTPSSGGSGGGGKSSAIDVVKESVDNNVDTHNAADDKEGELADNAKESTDSSKTEAGESTYSEEFIEAYSFAKSNGITTKSNIQEAQMDKTLTRIQMAKMLSYYAINVLGQEPDTSKTIKFRDVSSKKDAEYDNGVTLAYQLGIMGINMKNNRFRPNDEVTRAEFVTALSRMINGMKDGTGNMKYYEPHMARMYNEGIINNPNPKMKEKRGYVMIMLMRTVEK